MLSADQYKQIYENTYSRIISTFEHQDYDLNQAQVRLISDAIVVALQEYDKIKETK